jgi:hypothetical protein
MIRTQKLKYGKAQNVPYGGAADAASIVFADIFITYVLTAVTVTLIASVLSLPGADRQFWQALIVVILAALLTGAIVATLATIPTAIFWLLLREFFGESLPVCLLYGALVSTALASLMGDMSPAGLTNSTFAAPVGLIGGLIYWALGQRNRKGDSHD